MLINKYTDTSYQNRELWAHPCNNHTTSSTKTWQWYALTKLMVMDPYPTN